jgi:hypothetical protein
MTRPSFINRMLGGLLPGLLLALMLVLPAQAMQAQTAGDATPAASPAASPAADSGPRFVIRPLDGADGDYFTLEAEAGTTNELTVVLGNADDEMLTLRTYANDTVPMTNGGFSIAEEDAEPTGTATWIDYAAETFQFEPGAGVERTFTVTIPEDAEPGQYIAGLALQTAEPIEVEGTSLFNQIIRKTIAVFIIVPGPEQPEFALGEPEVLTDGAVDRIVIPVENTGNVLVKPQGELTLTDDTGKTVVTAPIAMGSVYAGTMAPLSVALTTTIPDADYAMSVEVTDEESGASASIDEQMIAITAEDSAASPIELTGDVTLAPDATNPAYADVSVQVQNQGDRVQNAEILLDVTHNGELVETFPIASSLTLSQGSNDVSQRYIPPTGWEAGTWEFSLRLNVIDESTNAETTVATLDSIPAIEVGE